MKATGVVRRIDDLGRVVIPKEIRRTLRIKEGDSLEIYVAEEKNIILKKHSLVNNIVEIAKHYSDALHHNSKNNIIITDTEKIIKASSFDKNELINNDLSDDVLKLMENRSIRAIDKDSSIQITNDFTLNEEGIFKPIAVYGDVVGSVLMYGENSTSESNKMLLETAVDFINNYLEN